MITRDHYAVLGVPRTAAAHEIRTAFKERALERHPDRAGAEATGEFQRLSDAYHILVDPKRRAAYDREQSQRESPTSGPVMDLRGPPPHRWAANRCVAPVFGGSFFGDRHSVSDAVEELVNILFREFGSSGGPKPERDESIEIFIFGGRR